MEPTPYPELNRVLAELVSSIQHLLGDRFVGAWLQGSFAIGDFDRHSDVDFAVALSGELSEADVALLQPMHERIYRLDCPWAQHLEGSYFPVEPLRNGDHCGKPLWYLDHGSRSLIQSSHCNTLVVRWTLREHGVVLAGPSGASLIDPISATSLRNEIREVMIGWHRQIVEDPEQINNRFFQAFAVLNYCRMLHDLHTGTIGSKRAGAEWVKSMLDPAWAGLIDRAWDGRPDPAVSVRERADPADFKKTLEFLRYIVGIAGQNDARTGEIDVVRTVGGT